MRNALLSCLTAPFRLIFAVGVFIFFAIAGSALAVLALAVLLFVTFLWGASHIMSPKRTLNMVKKAVAQAGA